jgi:hypothetical protein
MGKRQSRLNLDTKGSVLSQSSDSRLEQASFRVSDMLALFAEKNSVVVESLGILKPYLERQ